MDDRELIWRNYELNIDTYKHYLKLAIELNALYYAITGAIVSYYFAHTSQPLMRYSLLLPLAMSILFALLLGFGAVLNQTSRQQVFGLSAQLGFDSAPELLILTILLAVLAVMMLGVAIGLSILLFHR